MNIPDSLLQETKQVAQKWQEEISQNIGSTEKHLHEMMKKMLQDPKNKIFLIELLDQSFRSNDPRRVANQLEYVFNKYEGTDIFTRFESFLLLLFRYAGINLPSISIPLFIKYLRDDISNIVIKGESSFLNKHLQMRKKEGTRVNINIIGEAVLGEEEAKQRVAKYVKVLENPYIDYISIKISTICSQITPVAHRWSVEEIKKQLRTIYSAAIKNDNKFVNLDMEEYRDVRLTLDAFKETLMEDDFMQLHAGIVLQAYLPDSFALVKELSLWAKGRVAKGGAPIKVRLVKGANQEMELTEASLRNWECVTYQHKADTDANYKIMMDYLLSPDVAPFIHTGIASHNLFDHALARLIAKERGVEQYYTAEMLEGMSEAAYQLFKHEGMNVILYAPTATAETFTNAIAYLVRRFDENTAQQNFLRHSFGLQVGTIPWRVLLKSYDDALKRLTSVRLTPYRQQDRNNAPKLDETEPKKYRFTNESDTDFSLPQNQKWAEAIAQKWKNIGKSGGFHATPVLNGEIQAMQTPITVIDKSQYHDEVTVGSYCNASTEQIDKALEIAKSDPDGWRDKPLRERQSALMKVADVVREHRGDLIGIAAAEVGKVFSETDVEVSEAIDFLNFYPYSVEKVDKLRGITTRGKGVGLVVSPWNFPIAIPVGGVAASLAAGNTVILKPSSDAVLSAYALCQCFWDAGISKNTLQFVPVSGKIAGEHLIPSPLIDFVIFTGSETTAYNMLKIRPDLHLSAETGGKDATIVTAMADRDQAIKNVVASAFNNSGQKCSATSLLVLEKELYKDETFKQTLIDAARSLNVGSVWELHNRIGTLVNLPSGNLEKSLEYLDDYETWALAPSFAQNNNPYMLKPSIRWGTQENDFCHMNELFGPVLSVMCADNLEHAIKIVNETGYGLTSGLESLDEREQKQWIDSIKAGNLYVNRGTTGAIVLRQPFGGMGKSAIGSGKKAGGFNYVTQFMDLKLDHTPPPSLEKLQSDFTYWFETEFLKEHDYFHIRGESNHIRYLHVECVLIRISENTDHNEALGSIIAAKIVGCKVVVSIEQQQIDSSFKRSLKELLNQEDEIRFESDDELLTNLEGIKRIRSLEKDAVTKQLQKIANGKGIFIAAEPFIAHGRIELMHYLMEQSVTNSYHRYGNLGLHGLKSSN